MVPFVLKRLFAIVPTFFGVTLLTFLLVKLMPGDPVLLMLGERGGNPEVYAEMRANLGLDKPLLNQYGIYIANIFHGNFGISIESNQPVIREFFERFQATLELSSAAILFAIFLGIPIGILAAVKRNSIFDYTTIGLSLVGYSMPIFWWGLMLIIVFSVHLGWTPVSGSINPMYDIPRISGFLLIDSVLSDEGWPAFWDALRHLILPAIAMGTIPLAMLSRITRSSLLEVLGEDYIRTAKAKGLSRMRTIWVHALRNALIPVITVMGLIFGMLVAGAVLTETIFSYPGVGKWIVKSVAQRDAPAIQSGVLFIATMVISINLLVDVLYAWVNPRMRQV